MPEIAKTQSLWITAAKWLARFAWLLPPAVLAALLWRNAVNVPYWDEWDADLGGLFVKWHDGTLRFGDFWVQHNESRLVLPRLIYLLLGGFSHWNLLREVAFTFLLAGVAAAAVFWLGKKAFSDRPVVRRLAFFLASLLIFSPAQFEAWLWGMELILYLPLVCLLASLLMLRTDFSARTKILFCAGMAVASTYCFSNGLLAWIALFPPLFLSEGWSGFRKKSRAALCWLLGFVCNLALYFQDYQFPDTPGLWSMLRADPWRAAEYFCAFLGGPLTNPNAANAVTVAVSIGVVELSLFAAVGAAVFRRRKDSALLQRLWPWLTLGGYGLLSALLATSGRAAFGAPQALSSRYGIFGVCALVGLIYLLPLLAENRLAKLPIRAALALLAGAVVLLQARAFPAGVENFSVFGLELSHAKACLKFIDVLPPQPATRRFLCPNFPKVKRMADALDRAGVWNYSLHRSRQLAVFKIQPPPAGSPMGGIETGQVIGTNLFLSGWALTATRGAAADCVLFTAEAAGAEPEIVALMDQHRLRPDLVEKYQDQKFRAAGWDKLCPLADLPKGALTVKAWSYAVATDQLTPLAGEIHLANP